MEFLFKEKQALMIEALEGLGHTPESAREIADGPRVTSTMFDVTTKTKLKDFMVDPERGDYILDFSLAQGPDVHRVNKSGPKLVTLRRVYRECPILGGGWSFEDKGFSYERLYLEKACRSFSPLNLGDVMEIITQYRDVGEFAEPWCCLIIAYKVFQKLEVL